MTDGRSGTLRLFRIAGIDVLLHWTWLVIAAYEVSSRSEAYSSVVWNAIEYLALFAMVLAHELGHAFACHSVGGTVDRILLWPLGGATFMKAPARPGASLWCTAAGPLVNLVLVGILVPLVLLASAAGLAATSPDAYTCLRTVAWLNAALLVFNVLPIYPMDGGQMLRALLWFAMGAAKSLQVAAVLGLVGASAILLLSLGAGSVWGIVLSAFMLMSGWGGLRQARALGALASLPRRAGYRCPTCASAPPLGELWACPACGQPLDLFASDGTCPGCGHAPGSASCPHCGSSHPLAAWSGAKSPT